MNVSHATRIIFILMCVYAYEIHTQSHIWSYALASSEHRTRSEIFQDFSSYRMRRLEDDDADERPSNKRNEYTRAFANNDVCCSGAR